MLVANADGQSFVLAEVIKDVRDLLGRVYEGYTSIYADLKSGRLTEVGTINGGAVVRKAHSLGLEVPNHEFATRLIHALESRNTTNR